MGKFKYAKSSIEKLQFVHPKLRKVMVLAKEKADIDFDISEGYRSPERQKKLYLKGRSQLDGYKHLSKHNYFPALAVDIYAYNGTNADYSKEKMLYLVSVIKESAKSIGVDITCGADWKDFVDMPHIQLEEV